MFRDYLLKMVEVAAKNNHKNIVSMVGKDKNAKFLDLGCDDGSWTIDVAKIIDTKRIFGIEIVPERAKRARAFGVTTHVSDLNQPLPFTAEEFDVVHANQVIEHVVNSDLFLSEIYRVLRSGGYAVISTENLSSWHNIFALVLGFQPFSMTNYSCKGSIGNPLALWKKQESVYSNLSSWQHNRLFSYYGLKDLFVKHGFIIEKVKTAGYYPLPAFFSSIDPVHGHWITLKARKPG
jgi:ubiquinone/menaquinone biosynthesis C-methylase UbiE